MDRIELLKYLSERILEIDCPHTVRVAIDGVDCSGKTTIADELADVVGKSGRTVIRSTIDGFHNPREVRYSRGEDSPEGYYLDSFDYDSVTKLLLFPLGPQGNRVYRTRKFDFRSDTDIHVPELVAEPGSVLLFDGVFLLRDELIGYWDYKIFVDVSFDTVIKRAVKRDADYMGGEGAVVDRYNKRYISGQKIYFESVKPMEKADIVISNNNAEKPELTDL